MKKIILVLSIFAILSNSCTKENECNSNKACTEEFAIIDVDIIGITNGMIAIIDSSKTFKESNGELIYSGLSSIYERATILNDNHISEIAKKGETFIFEAYKDGQKVISEEYVIKHDCCHVIKVSGKERINL